MEINREFLINEKKRLLIIFKNDKTENKKDFYKELILFTVNTKDIWGDIRFHPNPSPPHEMREYYLLSRKDRKKVSSSFWRQEAVIDYMVQKSSIEVLNQSNELFLNELLSYIPEKMEDLRQKFLLKIYEFKEKGYNNGENKES